MTNRHTFLGITQDADCVTWDKLVALRELYNQIWDELQECDKAEGEKYGLPGDQHEIEDLPTVEGFFRLEVATVDAGGGNFVSTPGEVVFILTGGTLNERINDVAYNYVSGEEGRFNMVLTDPCNNCSKLHPDSRFDATAELNCPAGGVFTLYEGLYGLRFSGAPAACGAPRDWAANLDTLHEHMDLFDHVRYGDVNLPGDCHVTVQSCCDLFSTAHYEEVGDGIFGLKYIDIFVDSMGQAAMEGYLTTLILEEDLDDIQDRVISSLPDWRLQGYLCDRCASDTSPGCVGVPAGNTIGFAFKCTSTPTWSNLRSLNFVLGRRAVGGDCAPCGETGFGGKICTCPWEQLAGVMSLLLEHGCVTGCEEKCDGERDTWISISKQVDAGTAYGCGFIHSDQLYQSFVDHLRFHYTCPAGDFTCDIDRTTEVTGPAIVADPGGCGSTHEEDLTEEKDECASGCVGGGGSFGITETLSRDWEGLITQAAIRAFAIDNADTAITSHGRVLDVVCDRGEQHSGGFSIGSVSGVEKLATDYSEADYQHTKMVFLMEGDVIDATLHWRETIVPLLGGSSVITNHSASFNAGNDYTIEIEMATADNTQKTINNFTVTVP